LERDKICCGGKKGGERGRESEREREVERERVSERGDLTKTSVLGLVSVSPRLSHHLTFNTGEKKCQHKSIITKLLKIFSLIELH
jgi:hypothetical protein